jgi:hypothetical protein
VARRPKKTNRRKKKKFNKFDLNGHFSLSGAMFPEVTQKGKENGHKNEHKNG